MSAHLLVLILSIKIPKHHDMYLSEFPQIICPLSLKEYSMYFKWWARKDVIKRQFDMAIESHRELIHEQI